MGWLVRIWLGAIALGVLLTGAAVGVGSALPADVIAYSDHNGDLRVLDPARQLTPIFVRFVSHRAAMPSWSPDGNQLTYWEVSNPPQLMIVDYPPIAPPRSVTGVLETSGGHTWSPDGRWLAIVSQAEQSYQRITLVDAATGDLIAPLTPDTGNAFNPTWSPAGDWITFSWSPVANSELWRVPAPVDGQPSTAEPQRLTFDYRADSRPVYSPDGAWIAFESGRENNTEIFIMAADVPPDAETEIGLVNLSRSPGGIDREPTWSPDGQRVAFIHDSDGWQLVAVDRAQPGVRQVLWNGLTLNPAWRPRR